jgi:general L-amino acid transport system permease protein
VAVTNRGTNIPAPLVDHSLGGFEIGGIPINFTVLAFVAVLVMSFWANARILNAARLRQEATGDRPTTWWKSLLVLFVPVIALSVVLGLHWEIPALAGFNFKGGILVAHSFTALLVALTLYTAAFIAEIVRAGILAISKGQSEAAFALGLRPGRTMQLVILPQALRVIIPPLISQYLNITKNTSLGIAVSYLDLRGTLGGISLNQTGRELECMLLMMAIYLTLSLSISTVMNFYNKSVQLKVR